MIVGHKAVALGEPCYVIAEIGINHNGSVSPAKALIRAAADAGCDAVKFQKRTVPVIYTEAAAPVRRHGIRLAHAEARLPKYVTGSERRGSPYGRQLRLGD